MTEPLMDEEIKGMKHKHVPVALHVHPNHLNHNQFMRLIVTVDSLKQENAKLRDKLEIATKSAWKE